MENFLLGKWQNYIIIGMYALILLALNIKHKLEKREFKKRMEMINGLIKEENEKDKNKGSVNNCENK